MVGGGITFLGEKDLSISGLYHDKRVIVNSRIPFNKYKGITILLELETASNTAILSGSQRSRSLQKYGRFFVWILLKEHVLPDIELCGFFASLYAT